MRDLFQKIFGARPPTPPVTLSPEGVPGWLTERERAAKAALATGTRDAMDEIKNGAASLQLIVGTIAGAEQDPDLHPRLRTIVKNSLPQFVRGMKAALNREFPEDPETFYPVAAECLKNCLHTARGQGRYLQAVFPDEMKAVRHGIDTIGRGINTLNPLLAAYRKETGELAAARALFATAMGLRADLAASEEKVRRYHARIAEIRERCAAIEREQAALPQDTRMHEAGELRAALAGLCRQRDEASRAYSTLSMTASHVFRKAEKIAAKQRHPSEVAVLNAAMEVLSDHELPARDRLDEVLAAACPVAARMIGEGEVVLKNKEERAVFSDTPQFRADIGTAVSSLHALEGKCHRAEKALSSHPLLMKQESLEREKTQLAAMLAKEEEALAALGEWREKTEDHIPGLLRELGGKIAGMSGNTVHLQTTSLSPEHEGGT